MIGPAVFETNVVKPPAVPYRAVAPTVGSAAAVRRTDRTTWIATIVSTITPIVTSSGRVAVPTEMKNRAPIANPTATGAKSGRSRSHRALWWYHATANKSAVSRIGSVVPAIARPCTTVASNGVAMIAAPGNAVFDSPTRNAARAPTANPVIVNTAGTVDRSHEVSAFSRRRNFTRSQLR